MMHSNKVFALAAALLLLATLTMGQQDTSSMQECQRPADNAMEEGECQLPANDDASSSTANTTTTSPTSSTIVKLPKMPAAIKSILHETWSDIDPQGDRMLAALKSPGSLDFAHARDNFYTHLKGTFGILTAWNQPQEVCRTGMVHTAYSGDLYQFFLWDAAKDRASLRDIIGADAEYLTYLFGTINRGMLGNFGDCIKNDAEMVPLDQPHYNVSHRLDGTTLVSAKDAAKIVMVTIADYLDQMVDTNGWRDHHQVEFAERLYPGDGRPAIALSWFSSACKAIRPHLDVVPDVFEKCTKVLDQQDEIRARDAYWKVTLKEFELSEEEQLELLQECVDYNPYVGEPHVLLSQLHFRNQRYHQAALEARRAASKFYQLAAAWDKRRSFVHWVGFARMLALRSNRFLQGKTHQPYHSTENPVYTSAYGLYLTSLHDVAEEMKSYEEEED